MGLMIYVDGRMTVELGCGFGQRHGLGLGGILHYSGI